MWYPDVVWLLDKLVEIWCLRGELTSFCSLTNTAALLCTQIARDAPIALVYRFTFIEYLRTCTLQMMRVAGRIRIGPYRWQNRARLTEYYKHELWTANMPKRMWLNDWRRHALIANLMPTGSKSSRGPTAIGKTDRMELLVARTVNKIHYWRSPTIFRICSIM